MQGGASGSCLTHLFPLNAFRRMAIQCRTTVAGGQEDVVRKSTCLRRFKPQQMTA